jgi:peroxin-3
LRRRFEQNQEDCTYTVLALLPTIRDEIIEALPVEQITEQLQQERQERLKRLGQSEAASSEYPSGPPSVTDDASTSSFVHASQMASSVGDNGLRTKRSKAQLWQEMKINCKSLGNATHRHKLTWLQAVTRALTLLYTLSLLNILTRIQLNLLGRRTYLSSVVSLANPQANMQSSTISLENRDDDNFENFYGNDFETNRKYLTFSWWLLHRGSKQIMERVTAAVKEVFGAVNIREDITMERLADLIMQVRKKIEGPTDGERRQMRWLSYLLPPQDEEQFVIRQASVPDSDDSPSPETAAVQDPMSADVHKRIT